MMERQFKQKAIGSTGERFVANMFTDLGFKPRWNLDEFGYWDIEVDGLFYQIKTLTPFVKYNSWVINEHSSGKNIENLFMCDILIIVSLPTIAEHPTDGCILSINMKDVDRNLKYITESKSKGIFVSRDNKNLKVLSKITESNLKFLTKHSVSYFAKKL